MSDGKRSALGILVPCADLDANEIIGVVDATGFVLVAQVQPV
jgi:hypothetical protein